MICERGNTINFTSVLNPFEIPHMDGRQKSIIYFALGIYALMVSWYYNHSIILLIIHYIFWPIYLLYELLTGHLSHDMWKTIPLSYFK